MSEVVVQHLSQQELNTVTFMKGRLNAGLLYKTVCLAVPN